MIIFFFIPALTFIFSFLLLNPASLLVLGHFFFFSIVTQINGYKSLKQKFTYWKRPPGFFFIGVNRVTEYIVWFTVYKFPCFFIALTRGRGGKKENNKSLDVMIIAILNLSCQSLSFTLIVKKKNNFFFKNVYN